MKPLNEEQTHFLKTKLIPFAQNLSRQNNFLETLERILKEGQYDGVDKIIIEFLTNKIKGIGKMKPLNETQEKFIRNILLPFSRNSRPLLFAIGGCRSEDFPLCLEIVLIQKEYDKWDKRIIEFLIEELKKLKE